MDYDTVDALIHSAVPAKLRLLNWTISPAFIEPFTVLVVLEDAKRAVGVVRVSVSTLEECETDVQRLREIFELGHMTGIVTEEQ